MALGNADLRAKIVCISGKICLLVSAVLHLLVALAVIVIVAFTYGKYKVAYIFVYAAPAVFAVFSAIGSVVLLFIRKQLMMLVCISWPAIVFAVCAFFYGSMVFVFARDGPKLEVDGVSHEFPADDIVALFMGALILPLACHCIFLLSCLGCCKTDVDGGAPLPPTPSKPKKGKKGKPDGSQMGSPSATPVGDAPVGGNEQGGTVA
ncbi:unnamed protein product [Caenorhabditis sp. 36 PRJEB53466]|nr:unnamed protein product [Caenorhabditis sp. 36 PRJEB53466]